MRNGNSSKYSGSVRLTLSGNGNELTFDSVSLRNIASGCLGYATFSVTGSTVNLLGGTIEATLSGAVGNGKFRWVSDSGLTCAYHVTSGSQEQTAYDCTMKYIP